MDRPAAGALLVDTRPVEQRDHEGEVRDDVVGGFEAWVALGLPVIGVRPAA